MQQNHQVDLKLWLMVYVNIQYYLSLKWKASGDPLQSCMNESQWLHNYWLLKDNRKKSRGKKKKKCGNDGQILLTMWHHTHRELKEPKHMG